VYLTCAKCATKYFVKADDVGGAGKKVKCVVCSHVWFQTPALDELSAEAVMVDEEFIVGGGSNLPALAPVLPAPRVFKYAFLLSLLLLIAVSSLVAGKQVLKLFPESARYYAMLGVYNTEGVILEGVSVVRKNEGKLVRLVVSGEIANHSDFDRVAPNIRLAIYDRHGVLITSQFLTSGKKKLPAGESVSFANIVFGYAGRVDRVVVDLGDRLELASRW